MLPPSKQNPLRFIPRLGAALAMTTFFSCASSPWESEEKKIGDSVEKTERDAVIVCWEKPLEQYKSISNIKVYIPIPMSRDLIALEDAINFMRQKAGDMGGNALLLKHNKHSALYDANNDVNLFSFVQNDADNDRKILEGYAIWIEETRSTHGGDEVDLQTLPMTGPMKNIY